MSDDIIVRVNGDNSDVFDYIKRAETAATNAEQSEKDTDVLKSESIAAKEQAEKYSQSSGVSANSASNSNTLAQNAATRAEAAANRASSYEPKLKTSINGSVLSENTGHYNFLSPLTAVASAAGEFNVGFDGAGFMKDSVYDPNGILGDVYDRNNHIGQQSISTISGLQAVLDSKADSATGPGGQLNPLLMTKAVYDPNSINKNVYDRDNHSGYQSISTITGLQDELDKKVDDSEMTGLNIASLYEALPDRNKFSNDLLSKVNSISTGANMLKSMYDPSNVEKNAFNPANHNYENWPENSVVTVVGGKPTYTGVLAKDGSIITDSNSVEMGPHLMSSAGENVMWKNLHSGKIYAPPWQEVNRATSKLPTYRIYTDNDMSSHITTQVVKDEITNPVWTITADENIRLFAANFKSARDTKNARITVKVDKDIVWNGIIGDLKLNQDLLFNLDADSVPFDYYKNEILTFSISSEEGDVVLFGDASNGLPKVTYFYRVFDEIPIPDMDSSVYDKDGDGIIDESNTANKISGIDSATNSQYYGKDANGSVGFFNLPEDGSGLGKGDMLKSVYDTDDDGKVNLAVAADRADALTGVQGINPLNYYGKDADGNVGFHLLPAIAGDVNHLFDDLSEGDVPLWDAANNVMIPSGIRKIAGQTLTEPSGIYLGDVNLSSDGHGIIISPIDDPRTYKLLTQAITENTADAFIRDYGAPVEKVIHAGITDHIKNPTIPFVAHEDETIVSMDVHSSEVLKELKVSLMNNYGEAIWTESFFDLEAGSNTLKLATPPDVLSGEKVTLAFTGKSHSNDYVMMDGTDSKPYLKLDMMSWTEKKIATEDYVTSSISSLETTLGDTGHRVDNLDTTVNSLSQRMSEFQDYFVYRGKIAPVFPDDPQEGYFCAIYGMSKSEVITAPSTNRLHNGTIFFLRNEDATHSIRLEAATGTSINGGTSITLPPQTTLWLVHQQDNWFVMLSGYLPTSHAALMAEIKSQVSGASLGITVDDGTTNYGDIKLLKLKGITADRPTGDSIDSVTLTAENSWGTLGDSTSNAKGSIVLAEPPLQAYADPDDADTVRLRVEPGTFESVHAPGYLAYLNTNVGIVGKTHTATSHADGAIYPTDVVVYNGTYIIKDMKAKAIGLQEADQGDPNITGGTDYLVAFRVALEGEAPADGFVQIYLAEKAEFGQPVKYLEDSNGHPFVARRYYHLGDKMGSLETIGVVNAKGLKEFTMHVVDSFDNYDINILPRDRGVSGVMVQAILPTSKSGLASIQYEVDTEQNIEFTRYYMGSEMTSIDWLSSYAMPISEGTGGEGADFPDGLHLNNISNLMVGFVDGRMVIKDNGSNMVDFVFGKIEDAVPTYAMREKVLSVKLALTNKDAAFRLALVQWTGNPDEYTQEIYTTRSGGDPVFQSGWSLVDSLFIPEDAVNDDHEITHEFTVPKTAVSYAVIIYPETVQQPTELKLKTFKVGAKDPFYFYHIHQSRNLNELHLEYDDEFYESVQDAAGLYSLRYTINDDANGQPMPVGKQRKGKADIELDPTVNQIPGSGASGGEGALKFGKGGQATVSTLLNIASEQAKASNHPTEFWWVTVASDGTMSEIPDSRTTLPISGGSSGTYSMTSFTFAVNAGDRIALRAKSDMPDGAYLISIADKVPLVDVSINFKELTDPTADDPFADIDLSQFDRVYTGTMTATKFASNVSSQTFNIDIPSDMNLSVLEAVKQLPDNSVRPVKSLDWVYSNTNKTLTVSFGETVAIGAITIGVYTL